MVLLSLIGHVPLIKGLGHGTRRLVGWSVLGITLAVLGVGMFGHYNDWWDLPFALPAK
jgi:hypothetical protein